MLLYSLDRIKGVKCLQNFECSSTVPDLQSNRQKGSRCFKCAIWSLCSDSAWNSTQGVLLLGHPVPMRAGTASLMECLREDSNCMMHTFSWAWETHFLWIGKLFCNLCPSVWPKLPGVLQEAVCPECQVAQSSTGSHPCNAASFFGTSSALQELFLSIHGGFSTSPLVPRCQGYAHHVSKPSPWQLSASRLPAQS